ncbi:MAG TPA: shikimate kinase [Streptosporangiaceae bacterium]|nr:shikimate kinase [Streptosporangiaceae bacterium]
MTANGQAAGTGAAPFPLIILIGPPGAGKTTVGSLLAGQLGVGFTDTDAVIEAAAGKPVSDIFISDGEPEFRRLEREAVAAALAGGGATQNGPGTPVTGVLGLGGGAVMDQQTQARLAGRAVVYLETGFAELAKRVGLDQARPLLIGTNPRAQLKSLLDQRLPVYDRLAWLTVSTNGREPEAIAAQIAAVVAGGGRPGTGVPGDGR